MPLEYGAEVFGGRVTTEPETTSMTCRDVVDLLADHRSGELDRPTRERFEEHLRLCEQCAEYLRSYDDTVRLAKKAYLEPDAPAADEVPEQLIGAILASRSASPGRKRTRGGGSA